MFSNPLPRVVALVHQAPLRPWLLEISIVLQLFLDRHGMEDYCHLLNSSHYIFLNMTFSLYESHSQFCLFLS